MELDLVKICIVVGAILFSASFHEAAHALIAHRLGDPTGYSLGRVSLNPVRHLDPMMSIIMPAVLLIMTAGQFAFGGAKPVPINPYNFSRPGRDFAISAAAGPVANFILVAITLSAFYGLYVFAPELVHPSSYNAYFFGQLMLLNVVLGVFNLIPIPPLDGSRVFRLFLPEELQSKFDAIEPYGILILIIAIFVFGLSDLVVYPFINYTMQLLINIFGWPYVSELAHNIMNL